MFLSSSFFGLVELCYDCGCPLFVGSEIRQGQFEVVRIATGALLQLEGDAGGGVFPQRPIEGGDSGGGFGKRRVGEGTRDLRGPLDGRSDGRFQFLERSFLESFFTLDHNSGEWTYAVQYGFRYFWHFLQYGMPKTIADGKQCDMRSRQFPGV